MLHHDFADSADLEILAKAVDDHCSKYGIVDPETREHIAARVIHLFQSGSTDLDKIAAHLDDNIVLFGNA
jgi:hypothetical protein